MLIELAALTPLLAIGVSGLLRAQSSLELRALSVYLLCGWGVGTLIVVSHSPAIAEPARIERFEQVLTLLGGPLLLLYARAVTGAGGRFWLHVLPAVAWAGWSLLALLLPSAPHWGPAPFLLHQFCYTAVVILTVLRGSSAASQKPLALTWAKLVIAMVMLVHVASLLRLAFPGPLLRDVVPATLVAAFAVLIAAIAVHGGLLLPARFGARYARSARTVQASIGSDAQLLRAHLEQAKPFLDRELSSAKLAQQMDWTEQRLSQVLNGGMGQSYAEVIRAARLAEAKRLLLAPANARYTVEGIGLEAGFPSRASYYAAFKDLEGISPAQFRKRAQAGKVEADR